MKFEEYRSSLLWEMQGLEKAGRIGRININPYLSNFTYEIKVGKDTIIVDIAMYMISVSLFTGKTPKVHIVIDEGLLESNFSNLLLDYIDNLIKTI